MKDTVLYFGSFNPVHNGHTAIAHYVAQAGYGEVWLVVSPQNPLKPPGSLAPDLDRLQMVEIALEHLDDPLVKVCDVEFGLPKPSYTIDTLRVLEERYPDRRFSLLVGSDILNGFTKWKDYRLLLENYTILVYPRGGEEAGRFGGRVKLLGAPLFDFSSTGIRARLANGQDCSGMVAPGVLAYVKQKGLYAGHLSLRNEMQEVCEVIAHVPNDPELYIRRGKLHLRTNDFGLALNDFNRALELAPDDPEAKQYADMVKEILAFRNLDMYNP